MDAEELLKRYAAGERDFTEVDLSSADLAEAILIDIIMKNSHLSGASLMKLL